MSINYIDLGLIDSECRVTFEAENNLDFRLGTGKLRYTRVAAEGDLAVVSRIGEDVYELRIVRQDSESFSTLNQYAVHFVGHQGKRYGYLSNAELSRITGLALGSNQTI